MPSSRTHYELIYAPEGPKLDVKQQPWDLDTQEGKAEFVKDVSAMANSVGPENAYILLGVTDTERTPIGIEPGALQEERLQQIVAEYVDPPFNFSYAVKPLGQRYVGVITIPWSADKPHLINKDIDRLHRGTCYIRRGSITTLARSTDLGAMMEQVILSGTPVGEEDLATERAWTRADIVRLDRLALAILQCFIETDKTELPLTEIRDHCFPETQGAAQPGKVLAGKLKRFYSRQDKENLVQKNPQTGKWRFNDKYRSCVEEALHERGFI